MALQTVDTDHVDDALGSVTNDLETKCFRVLGNLITNQSSKRGGERARWRDTSLVVSGSTSHCEYNTSAMEFSRSAPGASSTSCSSSGSSAAASLLVGPWKGVEDIRQHDDGPMRTGGCLAAVEARPRQKNISHKSRPRNIIHSIGQMESSGCFTMYK